MSEKTINSLKISVKYMINGLDTTTMELHRWNLEVGMRFYRGFLVRFNDTIELFFTKKEELQKLGIAPTEAYIVELLSSLLKAQEKKDYILLADLLEMQIRPFLVELQEIVGDTFDSSQLEEKFSLNIEVLGKQNPKLVELVQAYLTSPEYIQNKEKYIVESTSSGFPTLKIVQEDGEYYQVSNNNPYRNIRMWLMDAINNSAKQYNLLGLAMGYSAVQLYNITGKVYPVHIFETDLHIIALTLHYTKLYDILQDNVFIHYDPDLTQLSASLKNDSTLPGDNDQLLIYPPAIRNIQNLELRKSLEKYYLEESSMKNARGLLRGNFLSNISYAKEHPENVENVDCLQQEFRGKNVYIIAAGPSLDKNLQLLMEKPANSIVIATGTVLRKLLELNMKPDYFIVSDGNERVTGQIMHLEGCGVPMLILSTANRRFMVNYQGKKFIILQKDYDKAEEQAKISGNNLYQTGGSVSTTALDVAIQLGAAKIIYLGLDLAFTDNLAHAEGTSNRVATDIEDLTPVKAYDGGIAYADTKFIIYREWMERRIREVDAAKVQIINATEGGSFVEGMYHMKLADFLER